MPPGIKAAQTLGVSKLSSLDVTTAPSSQPAPGPREGQVPGPWVEGCGEQGLQLLVSTAESDS